MTTRAPQPRLPIEPLEAWLNARYINTARSADEQLAGRLSARRIGELVGYHDNPRSGRSAVQRWRAGGVPLHAADRAAIRAGAHPLEVWPEFHSIEHDHDDDATAPTAATHEGALSSTPLPAQGSVHDADSTRDRPKPHLAVDRGGERTGCGTAATAGQ